jgi:hypothetical protein
MNYNEKINLRELEEKVKEIYKTSNADFIKFFSKQYESNEQFRVQFNKTFYPTLKEKREDYYFRQYLSIKLTDYVLEFGNCRVIAGEVNFTEFEEFCNRLIEDSVFIEYHEPLFEVYKKIIIYYQDFFQYERKKDAAHHKLVAEKIESIYHNLTVKLLSNIIKNPEINFFEPILELIFGKKKGKTVCKSRIETRSLLYFVLDNFNEESQLKRIRSLIIEAIDYKKNNKNTKVRKKTYYFGFEQNLNEAYITCLNKMGLSDEEMLTQLKLAIYDSTLADYMVEYYLNKQDYEKALSWNETSWSLNTTNRDEYYYGSRKADILALMGKKKESNNVYKKLLSKNYREI